MYLPSYSLLPPCSLFVCCWFWVVFLCVFFVLTLLYNLIFLWAGVLFCILRYLPVPWMVLSPWHDSVEVVQWMNEASPVMYYPNFTTSETKAQVGNGTCQVHSADKLSGWDFSSDPVTSEPQPLPDSFLWQSLPRQRLGLRKKGGRVKRECFVSDWSLCPAPCFPVPPCCQDSHPGGCSASCLTPCSTPCGMMSAAELTSTGNPQTQASSQHSLFSAMWARTIYFTFLSLFLYLQVEENNRNITVIILLRSTCDNNNHNNNYLAEFDVRSK